MSHITLPQTALSVRTLKLMDITCYVVGYTQIPRTMKPPSVVKWGNSFYARETSLASEIVVYQECVPLQLQTLVRNMEGM